MYPELEFPATVILYGFCGIDLKSCAITTITSTITMIGFLPFATILYFHPALTLFGF